MVVGGEVTTLKSLEESSGIIIAEMPINVYTRINQSKKKQRNCLLFLSNVLSFCRFLKSYNNAWTSYDLKDTAQARLNGS